MSSTTITTGGLVTFSIKVNGSSTPDEVLIQSIRIDTNVNEIPHAQIKIIDGDLSKETFPVSSSSTFVPGNTVVIEAGYDNKNKQIFKGIITGQSINVTKNMDSMLIVDCYDEAIKMTVGEKNKIYTQKTDSVIIASIIRNYSGLSSDIVTSAITWPEIIQSQYTDWNFIRYRAEVNGWVVITKDSKVSLIKPETYTSSVLEIEYGNNLFGFKGTLNAINQLGSYTTEAWNETSEKMIKGTANNIYAGSGNLSTKKLSKVLNVNLSNVVSTPLQKHELEELSKNQLIKSAFSKIQGSAETQGTDLVSPGVYITLDGLGDRFNGKHFVSGVCHTIESGNWITKITIGMSVVWVTPEPNRIGSIQKNV